MKSLVFIVLIVVDFGKSVTTTASSSPSPPPSAGSSCYESDSSISAEIHFCTLRNYCFSTLRRKRDGTVVYKRGCSNTCEEESRNRKIRRCCISSLCNMLVQDPLEDIDNGSGTMITPLLQEVTTPLSSTPPSSTAMPPPSSSQPGSPPPPPPTNMSTQPLILNSRPPTPTSPPPTTTPPIGRSEIICYCDDCGEATICQTTNGFCATLWAFQIPEPGTIPDPNPQSHLTITNFCISNMVGCPGSFGTGLGEMMMCCDTSYCNNHREHTTAPPTEPTEPVTAAITMATTTGREDSTSDTPTSRAIPTLPSASQRNLDFYITIAIGIFIVAGIILVIIMIVVICYCCITRKRSSSRGKAKKAASLSCPSTMVTTAGGNPAAAPVANMELAAVNIELAEANMELAEGNSRNSWTKSGAPIPEGIPQTE